MASSGPIIEELPDDYDPSAEQVAPTTASSSTAPTREVRSSTASSSSGSAGLRKGFFNKPSASSTTVVPDRSAVSAPPAQSVASTDEKNPEDGKHNFSETRAAEEQCRQDIQQAEISSLLDSLRTRLSDACTAAASRRSHRDEGETEALRELREVMSSTTQSQSRWPTTQARSALTKSSLEANTAMAEMRSASNDARRMRSGEEKKVITELRRVTDDILERVRKVVDISSPKPLSEEDKARSVVAAFHSLPFTVKLRVLADERSALTLFLLAFALGAGLILGMMVEVYVAWGCGYRCGAT